MRARFLLVLVGLLVVLPADVRAAVAAVQVLRYRVKHAIYGDGTLPAHDATFTAMLADH